LLRLVAAGVLGTGVGGLAGCTGNGDESGGGDGGSGDGGDGGESGGDGGSGGETPTPTFPPTSTDPTGTPTVTGAVVHNGVEGVEVLDHRPVFKTGGVGVTMTVENTAEDAVELRGIEQRTTGESVAYVGIRWLTDGGNVVNTTGYVNFRPAQLQPGTSETYEAVGESPRGEAARYELCIVSEAVSPARDWPEACA
jgi:hypothetical protein